MINELVNLSAGRVIQHFGSAESVFEDALNGALITPKDTAEELTIAEPGIDEPQRDDSDPPISTEEFAALAYSTFGADDCPTLAENYALSDDTEASLPDAAIEPPADWSDTAFIAADNLIKSTLERGIIGSTFPYAKATRKEALGTLPTPAIVETLRLRGAPVWLAREVTEMALKGAPLAPTEGFARALHRTAGGRFEIAQLAGALSDELPTHVTHVLLVPWLDSGGAEQVALWHARAIDAAGGRCVVIGTDAAKHAWVSRLPASTRYICLSRLLEASALTRRLSADDCAAALGAALSSISFRALHVITSYVGARMLRLPIDWRSSKVYFSLFGIGCDSDGLEAGYWFEASNLHRVDRFLTDNRTLPSARSRSFGLSPGSVYPISYPVEPTLRHSIRRRGAGPHRVLWASRLDREKQPSLVFDIARRMPEVEFHMFGRAVLGDAPLPPAPPNVFMRGGFDGWSSIPAERFDCFLFTSLWEGLPNIVLEAMGSGLPVIASRVGAVEELVDANRGWLVAEYRDPSAFVRALEEALENPKDAVQRAHAALLEVTRNRTFAGLMRSLHEVEYL